MNYHVHDWLQHCAKRAWRQARLELRNFAGIDLLAARCAAYAFYFNLYKKG